MLLTCNGYRGYTGGVAYDTLCFIGEDAMAKSGRRNLVEAVVAWLEGNSVNPLNYAPGVSLKELVTSIQRLRSAKDSVRSSEERETLAWRLGDFLADELGDMLEKPLPAAYCGYLKPLLREALDALDPLQIEQLRLAVKGQKATKASDLCDLLNELLIDLYLSWEWLDGGDDPDSEAGPSAA